MSEMARTTTRVIELVRGNTTRRLSSVTSLKSQDGEASARDQLWSSHIFRLSHNPDSKVALFAAEIIDSRLRADLVQKNIDLHEFVIEHPEEYYQNE
jgi:hypothetical protein